MVPSQDPGVSEVKRTSPINRTCNVLLGTVSGAEKRILVKYSVSLGPLGILKYAEIIQNFPEIQVMNFIFF